MKGILFIDIEHNCTPLQADLCMLKVGGLTIIQRILYSSLKAGLREIYVITENDTIKGLINSDERLKDVTLLSGEEFFKKGYINSLYSSTVIISPTTVFDTRLLKRFIEIHSEHTPKCPILERPFIFGTAQDLLNIKRLFLNRYNIEIDIKTVEIDTTKGIYTATLPSENNRLWFTINNPSDIPELEKRLFNSLIKDTESFMSRHIERKISLAITKQLVNTSITPNQLTIITMLIGIAGGILLGTTSKVLNILGGCLFILSSITDGCDGELARIKFKESKLGSWLDIICDNIVHIFVFCGIAVSLYLKTNNTLFLLLGIAAAIGVILNTTIVYYKTLFSREAIITFNSIYTSAFKSKSQGRSLYPFSTSLNNTSHMLPKAKGKVRAFISLVNISDYLARRDFTYLVLILAIFERLEWFLWATVIGLYIFFIILIIIFNLPYFKAKVYS